MPWNGVRAMEETATTGRGNKRARRRPAREQCPQRCGRGAVPRTRDSPDESGDNALCLRSATPSCRGVAVAEPPARRAGAFPPESTSVFGGAVLDDSARSYERGSATFAPFRANPLSTAVTRRRSGTNLSPTIQADLNGVLPRPRSRPVYVARAGRAVRPSNSRSGSPASIRATARGLRPCARSRRADLEEVYVDTMTKLVGHGPLYAPNRAASRPDGAVHCVIRPTRQPIDRFF
jgi:hypothetical protein